MIRVLLVEDELLVRTGMKSLIEWEAYGFVLAAEASHGQEALEILKSESVDIVITDIRMPVMDGIELIEQIRMLDLPCEIIVLSSYDDFAYVKRAMQLRVLDYIHKPTMTPQELMDMLKRVSSDIATKRKTDSLQQIILETVSESRELMIEKWLRQLLMGTAIDDLREQVMEREIPFYLAALRWLPSVTYDMGVTPSEHDADMLLGIVVEESNKQKQYIGQPVYYVKEGDWRVFFLPDKERSNIFGQLEQRLSESGGLKLLWSIAERPCVLEEASHAYQNLKQDMQESYNTWEKLQRIHPLIKESLYYIRDHYMDHVTLESVSSCIHTSPVYLSRLFLKEIGQTFIDYLTHYRIKQAKMMLTYTDLKTYDIADKVGYKNSKYFLRVFRKLEGMTPGAYRDKTAKSK